MQGGRQHTVQLRVLKDFRGKNLKIIAQFKPI
jgi:hypothetical protein